MEKIVIKQYQSKVNQAIEQFDGLPMLPPEGWLRTVRNALGMTGLQLAQRLGVSKAQVSKAEKGELAGSVKLETIKKMADAMNCRFVYAVVPEKEIGQVIKERAIKKAKERVNAASTHMALEDQVLSKEALEEEVERIASEIMEKMPSDLWREHE